MRNDDTIVPTRCASKASRIAMAPLQVTNTSAAPRAQNRAMPADFLAALVSIVVIDLALAGDNAIVIALAARGLPPQVARRAILWGTAGAIAVRCLMTLGVVWLLRIPGLLAAGGAVLLWIAYRLGRPQEKTEAGGVQVAKTFRGAMQAIVVADATMGLDNVLAVAGAAHGSFVLVVAGLLLSIPIVVWGSTLVLRVVDRYPGVVKVGVAVLAWTAAKMIVDEPLFHAFFSAQPALAWLVYALVIGGVFAALRGYGAVKPLSVKNLRPSGEAR
jgi:YjbE family integral membrane protein